MLTLNVGFNRKVGEANYGSRGASVELQLELESGLVDQPDRLRERIRQLFVLAKTCVDEELNSTPATDNSGHATNGNGHRRNGARKATGSQARALHLIADRQGIDLAGLLRERFGVDQAGDISITEASALIDELKGQTNGNGAGGRR
jgi:hypothetical protein